MKHPVILFVFNRPEQTSRVLEQIINAEPKKLYIFADGPRNSSDGVNISKVRHLLEEMLIGKKFEIIKNYALKNQGLTSSIISGLNSVFQIEESAVILEDDCFADSSFFVFAEQMLDMYKKYPRVLSISGRSSGIKDRFSYNFSKYPQCWGWATWARAWKKYDFNITDLDYEENILHNTRHVSEKLFWREVLSLIRKKKINTWDYQWTFTHLLNDGLAITPNVNLVKNIGFGVNSTNTRFAPLRNSDNSSINFPLINPQIIENDIAIDDKILNQNYLSLIPILGLLKKHILG